MRRVPGTTTRLPERITAERASHTGTHVAARAGLRWELRRCRLAVDRLDAIVRASFAGDRALLGTWRAAKRVHQLPRRPEATIAALTASRS